MKKKLSIFMFLLLLIISLTLTACGSTYAEIYGIVACIGVPEDDDAYGVYNSTFADKTTLEEHDYVLEVGKTYYILVAYSAGNGSKYPVIANPESVIFHYDTNNLEIQSVMPNDKSIKHYALTCKQAIRYSAILIELDEYSYTIIVSANR
jgi:hypothetical protein